VGHRESPEGSKFSLHFSGRVVIEIQESTYPVDREGHYPCSNLACRANNSPLLLDLPMPTKCHGIVSGGPSWTKRSPLPKLLQCPALSRPLSNDCSMHRRLGYVLSGSVNDRWTHRPGAHQGSLETALNQLVLGESGSSRDLLRQSDAPHLRE
jgi:hypothetical protein